MPNKAAFEAVDKTLQDICNNRYVMGGKTFVMAGDFRQTLPVIERGTRANEVKASNKSSHLWRHVNKLHLTTNMRVHLSRRQNTNENETVNTDATDHFSRNLLHLGNGNICTDENGQIDMKDFGTIVESMDDLINSVYPEITDKYKTFPIGFNFQWLCSRAILAPKNDIVEDMNLKLLQQIPTGDIHIYKSIDTVPDTSEAVQYPIEFLNSLDLPGVPPHRLQLKVGAPIILLRNLDPPKLCNGTRLVVRQLMPHVIDASILTGVGKKDRVFIPRIPIIPTKLPFQFKRLQFPVRLCFAMTINKAQGQTLRIAGLNLTSPCFSHGQLYVGCSRVGSPDNLFILAPNGKTTNIVYPEAL